MHLMIYGTRKPIGIYILELQLIKLQVIYCFTLLFYDRKKKE